MSIKTYLDLSILHDDNLQMPGYNLYKKDHPLSNKRGRVFLFTTK